MEAMYCSTKEGALGVLSTCRKEECCHVCQCYHFKFAHLVSARKCCQTDTQPKLLLSVRSAVETLSFAKRLLLVQRRSSINSANFLVSSITPSIESFIHREADTL